MKPLITLLLCVGIVLMPIYTEAASISEIDTLIQAIPQDGWPQEPTIKSESAILLEVNSGTILYAKNATEAMFPASTTKLMTALLTVENSNMEDIVTFSSKAVNSLEQGASHIGIRPGEKLTVEDSLYGLLLPSANEVANGLAEHISGDMVEFAEMMNARAVELGAVNTHFTNPNGLHDPDHYTCAYDLALIMATCIKNQNFIKVASTPAYVRQPDEILNKEIPMRTTHQMLRSDSVYYNENVVSGKTGWTPDSGRCLVTYAKKGNMDLISVTLNAQDPDQYIDTQTLLDYGFDNFKVYQTSDSDNEYSTKSLSFSTPLMVPRRSYKLVQLDSNSQIVLPLDVSFSDLAKDISYPDQNLNPYGVVTYLYKGYKIGEAKILSYDTERNNSSYPSSNLESTEESTGTLIVLNIWVLAGCVILLILVLYGIHAVAQYNNPKNRRRRRNGRRRKIRFSKNMH